MFHNFNEKDLCKPSTTRFLCSCIVLSNYFQHDKVNGGLRRMILLQHRHAQGRDLKQGDETRSFPLFSMLVYLSSVNMIMKSCKPPLKLICLANKGGASMRLIYEQAHDMMPEINNMIKIELYKDG